MAAKKVAGKKPGKKRGPKPEIVKIEGDWTEAVKQAMKRGKPPKEKRD
jgi:hypothetical protein